MERRVKGTGWMRLLAALVVGGLVCHPAPAAAARLLVGARGGHRGDESEKEE